MMFTRIVFGAFVGWTIWYCIMWWMSKPSVTDQAAFYREMERDSMASFAQQVLVLAEFHRLKTGLGRVDQDELILSDGGGR
jgi:hypothetical protein